MNRKKGWGQVSFVDKIISHFNILDAHVRLCLLRIAQENLAMKFLPITCPFFILFLWFNAACSPVVHAGNASSEGAPLIAPIQTDGTYENWIPTEMIVEGGMASELWKWIIGGERQKPGGEIPVVLLDKDSLNGKPADGLTVRWLGHSSVLIEISGRRVLIDPVFSRYASPVPGFVKRFSKAPISADELKGLDAVVISHDHYDHLDKDAIKSLARSGVPFFVPTGVAAYLQDWGVPAGQIRELTWWEESTLGTLTFICVPARHFSGRGLFTRNDTLWAGWIVQSETRKLYFSGDTGYAEHFKAIGDTYGPFDLTLIKIGAYSDKWPYIHVKPEEAVKAHTDVKGKVFLPVHWGTFTLALHAWDEPIIRAVKAAKQNGVRIVTPIIGELVDIDKPITNRNWWEEVK